MLRIEKFLQDKISKKLEKKHFDMWSKQARYVGNSIYTNAVTGGYSTDTRELLLMYVADKEGIQYERDGDSNESNEDDEE